MTVRMYNVCTVCIGVGSVCESVSLQIKLV